MNAPAATALCRIGGTAAWLLAAYSVFTMIQLVALGGPPASADEAFRLLHSNRVLGLLRLDLPTILALPLYYVVFLGLFEALRQEEPAQVLLATVLACAGVTLTLSTPTALSMVPLSDKYAAATSETIRRELLAAGEALLAADIWHSTAAWVGAILLQIGAVGVSVVMLRTSVFSRTTAYVGIVTHGLDLLHVVVAVFVPAAGVALMAVAGPLYLVWFPLVARRLRQLGTPPKGASHPAPNPALGVVKYPETR